MIAYSLIQENLDWPTAREAMDAGGTIQRASWGSEYALRRHYHIAEITIFRLARPAEHCPYEIFPDDAQATDWRVIDYKLALPT